MNGIFSIIVPVYTTDTIGQCIEAIEDQDYKKFEVIFAVNDPKGKAVSWLTKKYKSKYKIVDCGYKKELKSGNKCRAFNKAKESAIGEYLLFLDSDCFLYPGTLTEYALAFENSEADFVYGHYDFDGAGRLRGRPFDEYQLKCSNYISGNYPMRATVNPVWDENLTSLQDWDMWLTVVENGHKGLYIDRPCFHTPSPTAQSISGDSSLNWKERFEKVRLKHNFPISETAVISLGAYNHATNIAEVLGVDVRVLTNVITQKPHEFKNIYLLGFYPGDWHGHMLQFYNLGDVKQGIAGQNRIIHWIGTDIYQMQHKLSWVAWKNVVTTLNAKEYGFTHLCEAVETQRELEELGIKADIVPLPAKQVIPLSPLPKKFTVGVYINEFSNMYYEDMMYQIADAMPDVEFKFFGNRSMVKKEGNKEWVGYVDMAEFLPSISALVRIAVHDGLPISPIEAMMAGRNVLATFPMRFAQHIAFEGQPEMDKIIDGIRELEKLPLNKKGSEYWQKELSPETYRERMKKYGL